MKRRKIAAVAGLAVWMTVWPLQAVNAQSIDDAREAGSIEVETPETGNGEAKEMEENTGAGTAETGTDETGVQENRPGKPNRMWRLI